MLTYETAQVNGKETTQFVISVSSNGEEYTVKKRFSNFDELRDKLIKLYDNIPELPSKSLLKVSKPADLDKRRGALEKFLKVEPN